jgi:hypothetical protein
MKVVVVGHEEEASKVLGEPEDFNHCGTLSTAQ